MKGFVIDQQVRVKEENPGPNRRVPHYIRGRAGVIVGVHGVLPNYQHDHADDWGPLYSVLFDLAEVFSRRSHNEKVIVDIHEPWLEPI